MRSVRDNTEDRGQCIKIERLTQKVSFCFLGRVKFRKVMLEKLNSSHSCGAGPPVHKARPLKKVLTIYVSENRIYE